MMHDLIQSHRGELVAAHLRDQRAKHPERSEEELLDGIAEFFDLLLAALSRRQTLTARVQASAYRHGLSRLRGRFAVCAIVHDYGLVCDVISRLGIQLGAPFEARDVLIMNQSVDAAIAGALDAYWHASQREPGQDGAEHLGIFAHEVRNAVSTAAMTVQLLKRGQVSPAGATLAVLERAVREIERIVTSALSEARLGASSLRPERVDLSTFLADLAGATVPERGVRIDLQVSGELWLQADPQHLTSALGNLLRNAIKFTHDGQTVRVRARRVAEARAVAVEVEDRCGGLPPGMAEDLFQPFVQRSAERSGAGLGLTIARKAVAAHGGTLTVEDLPGLGCVFRVVLPLSADAARA